MAVDLGDVNFPLDAVADTGASGRAVRYQLPRLQGVTEATALEVRSSSRQ